MTKWLSAGPIGDLEPGSKKLITLDGTPIVLCRLDAAVAAVANNCPHAGQPLAEGELRGSVLRCAYHGYGYDVTTGRNVDHPHEECPVRTYPVRVTQDNQVEVGFPQD